MNVDQARLDRMIKAFKEMTGNTEVIEGKSYGICKKCKARIEWVTTVRGKLMALVPNVGEPHIPHCGKNNWTRKQWENQLREYMLTEIEKNRITLVTIPDGKGIKTLKGKEADKFLRELNSTTDGEPPWVET